MATPGQIIRHPAAQGSEEHRIYFPNSYDPSRTEKYPVILYMHGAGGVGNPTWSLSQGLPAMLTGTTTEELAISKEFPFIVIVPMACPRIKDDENGKIEIRETITHLNGYVEECDGKYLTPCQHWLAFRPRILELLDYTLDSLGGDACRVYLAGMSIGGKGVMELAAAEPDRFAAVVSVRGHFGNREAGLTPPMPHNAVKALTVLIRAGMSIGGKCVMELAAAEPDRFAAVVSVCGYFGNRENGNSNNSLTPPMPPNAVKALTGMPMWLFHSKDDSCVLFQNSKIVADAMRAANGDEADRIIKFTEYDTAPPGTSPHDMSGKTAPGHGSFELAFREAALYSWLSQQKKA